MTEFNLSKREVQYWNDRTARGFMTEDVREFIQECESKSIVCDVWVSEIRSEPMMVIRIDDLKKLAGDELAASNSKGGQND